MRYGSGVEVDKKKLKKSLSKEQYNVCFLKGTEPPFSGKYYKNNKKGAYLCVVCGSKLFLSDQKYDSGTGWPSFWDLTNVNAVRKETDTRFGVKRTEVSCASCGSHLGHVFDDGPKPTGLRYCINSLSLEFVPDK